MSLRLPEGVEILHHRASRHLPSVDTASWLGPFLVHPGGSFPRTVHAEQGGVCPLTVVSPALGPGHSYPHCTVPMFGGHTGHTDHKTQTSNRGPGPLPAPEESLVYRQLTCPTILS